MPEDVAPDERLAVLRLVESGKVRPEEALELLSVLQPASAAAAASAPPPPPRRGGVVLRVHCEMEETECDFSVPLEAASEIAEMLPADLGAHVPPKMLQQLSRLVDASRSDDVVRYHEGEFELVIRREEG